MTLADGSTIKMIISSPRSKLTLVRDVTNHGLWNPSLAREVADADESGRVGRFSRRYRHLNQESSSVEDQTELQDGDQALKVLGTSNEDLSWMSGDSPHTFYGVGDAKNIAGYKKPNSKRG